MATAGAGGSSGGAGSGGHGGTIDCSLAGCAPPPMCKTGCTEVCGCCSCADGMVQGNLVCNGGCWVESGDGGSEGCSYRGRVYPVGATFREGDGCNTCGCSAGLVVGCTKKACLCDPVAEAHQRQYIGMSPAACTLIDFACTGNTTMFGNMCGCGCEQDPSCPDWFNCQPSPDAPPCDMAEMKRRCPYSGFAL
jgi:hypothetical protein